MSTQHGEVGIMPTVTGDEKAALKTTPLSSLSMRHEEFENLANDVST